MNADVGPTIRFQQVSKRFLLTHNRDRTVADLLLRLLGRRRARHYFWPIRELTFAIAPGTTFGIIGENGTGKSTILKLVSRILEPTSGTVEVNGRVSALLELGAGFHPELTGRENIYLNGSLLGLGRAHLASVLPQIVQFADIGPFIDMPVKNYSSGMYARLGFAIAVHVDPDILLVDEVLAVGDEAFQRRCLNAIERLQGQGKTILIVSHSLSQLLALCDQGLWLDDGRIGALGAMGDVVRTYLHAVDAHHARGLDVENAKQQLALAESAAAEVAQPEALVSPPRRWGIGPIQIERVAMLDDQGQAGWSFCPRQPVHVRIEYRADQPIAHPIFSILIHKLDGRYLWSSNTLDHAVAPIEAAGSGWLTVTIAGLALTAARYYLSAAAYVAPDPPFWRTPSDFHEWLYEFQVVSATEIHGDLVMPSQWAHRPPSPAPVGSV